MEQLLCWISAGFPLDFCWITKWYWISTGFPLDFRWISARMGIFKIWVTFLNFCSPQCPQIGLGGRAGVTSYSGKNAI